MYEGWELDALEYQQLREYVKELQAALHAADSVSRWVFRIDYAATQEIVDRVFDGLRKANEKYRAAREKV